MTPGTNSTSKQPLACYSFLSPKRLTGTHVSQAGVTDEAIPALKFMR